MKKLVNLCDRCGAECAHESLYVTVNRQMDAAGSMDDVIEDVDLCGLCLRAVMEGMLKEMDYEQRAHWLAVAKTKLKPVRM